MEINWKEVCKCPGYLSMKAAVADEAKRTAKWGRKPDERYMQSFNFAINRAKHYAHIFGVTLDVILNQWEERRDYNFISFYSNHNLQKEHSNSRKILSINGQIRNYKKDRYYINNPKEKQEIILLLLIKQQKSNSKKAKPRWSSDRKMRGY